MVIDDDWFKQYHDNGDFSHYTITRTTYLNLKKKYNKQISLNKQDKKKINKHVDDVLGRGEIHTIKRYKKTQHESDKFEHVDYLELKTNAGNPKNGTTRKDYVTYSSSSRYDYIGIDEKGRSHFYQMIGLN